MSHSHLRKYVFKRIIIVIMNKISLPLVALCVPNAGSLIAADWYQNAHIQRNKVTL